MKGRLTCLGERSGVGGCDTSYAIQRGNLKAGTTPAKNSGEHGGGTE